MRLTHNGVNTKAKGYKNKKCFLREAGEQEKVINKVLYTEGSR